MQAMTEPKITLFDILSPLTEITAWSPNTWKTRFVLNYKAIPYKTEWISFSDVESTLVKLGATASSKRFDKPLYTVPAILDETGDKPIVVVDSLAIAEYLDEKYPERPVMPKQGKALQYFFDEYLKTALGPSLFVLMVPRMEEILDESGQEFFRRTRAKRFGKKFEEISPDGPVRDGQWKQLEEAYKEIGVILDKNGLQQSWVAGGSGPTMADFLVSSYLTWIKIVDPKGWASHVEKWENGRWEKFLKKFDQWTTVL